ncbi:hypothetical protein EVAR_74760_1 [Eumeta japonica]|uniref:Uncharacterized protein n=1 Tax=Eumeta variegata TaxID=151549 RepID=A0A4C1SPX7_EUMVA|nr:hypothetical protein EVAR_74760_1 [Eumeta japonica]
MCFGYALDGGQLHPMHPPSPQPRQPTKELVLPSQLRSVGAGSFAGLIASSKGQDLPSSCSLANLLSSPTNIL